MCARVQRLFQNRVFLALDMRKLVVPRKYKLTCVPIQIHVHRHVKIQPHRYIHTHSCVRVHTRTHGTTYTCDRYVVYLLIQVYAYIHTCNVIKCCHLLHFLTICYDMLYNVLYNNTIYTIHTLYLSDIRCSILGTLAMNASITL